MNQLSSRNRKLVYMFGILALLIPIGALGMPAQERSQPGQPGQSGGKIARLRHNYRLGETTLGDVDPASATMNLVLLGMRGIAASMLWVQADEQKSMKNWSEHEQTVESIIKLQPRFLPVWKYQGWNLAFNVSVECDAVEDRYFWVKKGAKFMIRGTKLNEDAAELYHDTGTFFGKKIGRSDEYKYFRKFFMSDPDPRWDGRADEEINPDGRDNYLVAKDKYRIANEKEQLPWIEQHIMARSLFRSYPARSQMDYAMALADEGQFDAVALNAWKIGNADWTTDYGRELFQTPGGEVMLDATEEELKRLADEDPDHNFEEKKFWQDKYQNTTNYRYWKIRSQIESEPAMLDARQKLRDGRDAFIKQDGKAHIILEEGLQLFEGIFDRYPELLMEFDLITDVIKAQLMWRHSLVLIGESVPEEFPMSGVWNSYPGIRAEQQDRFERQFGASGF